jgi:hypothetical protein
MVEELAHGVDPFHALGQPGTTTPLPRRAIDGGSFTK